MHPAAATPADAVVIAIDPGSEFSGVVILHPDGSVEPVGKLENEAVLHALWSPLAWPEDSAVVIEWTAPRGMPASAQLFETLWWAGRFTEAAKLWAPVYRLERAEVKRHMCGTSASKDSNVIAALVDRFGGAGGRKAAVGTKTQPGPLYGVKADVWQALAVAVTYADRPELAR